LTSVHINDALPAADFMVLIDYIEKEAQKQQQMTGRAVSRLEVKGGRSKWGGVPLHRKQGA
jgi:hypothetical protein